MNIVKGPSVYLVTRSNLDEDGMSQFFRDEAPDGWLRAAQESPESIAEAAARLCYMSFEKGRTDIQDFMQNILSQKHGSVLEHVSFGFIFAGVSRTLTHELVRHRAGFAYSQLSQRYVGNPGFVVPPDVQGNPLALDLWRTSVEDAAREYDTMVEALMDSEEAKALPRTARIKFVRQAARSVLPGCTETKIFVTANVRAWRHFLEMRGSEHAEPEIRRLALLVLEQLEAESPLLFGDFERVDVDGVTVIRPQHSKV